MKKVKPPIQSRWFKVGKGYLCFAIIKLPNWSFTIEVKCEKAEASTDTALMFDYDFAACFFCFAVMYHWQVANT